MLAFGMVALAHSFLLCFTGANECCCLLFGMYDNLVDDKLTTSGKNAVLNAFTHHCDHLNRVRVIDHAFARLQDAQPSQAQAFLRQAEAFLRQKRMPVRKRSESMTN